MTSIDLKNILRVLLLLLPLILLINLRAEANCYQSNKQRIKHGIRNGSLSKWEADKLIRENEELRFMVRRAKADGIVTRRERARIQNQKRNLDLAIRKEKNDWFFL